ncbi:Hypothetical predicted protein [Xyrichtys novacula]|uniref:Uncharacterized protein n=1 Tax=Xyrichtys novacula TaxID=13765 RepID=A0AAV1FME3_XYRNO|nr:Hypothetical predicted protein [Xyrichtys novacula]
MDKVRVGVIDKVQRALTALRNFISRFDVQLYDEGRVVVTLYGVVIAETHLIRLVRVLFRNDGQQPERSGSQRCVV